MQQLLDTLQQQLEIVKQFENLFDVLNVSEFKIKLGKSDANGTFLNFMRDAAQKKCILAFNSPTTTSSTPPADNLAEAIACLKNFLKIKNPPALFGLIDPNAAIFEILDSRENAERNVTFFREVISAMQDIAQHKKGSAGYKDIQKLHSATKTLIQTQKEAVQQAIHAVDYEKKSRKEASLDQCSTTLNTAFRAAKTIHKYVATSPYREKRKSKVQDLSANVEDLSALEAKKPFRKKCARYTGAAVLATGGTAAIAFSTLMQFGPQFAMLASLNLPPVALAAIAVSGVAMVAAAAYVAYRTYKPAHAASVDTTSDAPVVTNPAAGYSKFLTPVLATVGLGLVGFSALVQFSPTFALLMGLHLTPAALMSVAAVGVLLLSASLYRACKAYAQSRADATAETDVVNAEATEPTNSTCMQRLYQYTNCCFKLFSPSTTAANSTTSPLDSSTDHTAKV